MNTVILIGRLTKDCELKYTTNETPVATFSIAVNRDCKNDKGEYEADFINCKVFGSIAETVSKYSKKGDLLGVSGRIQTGSYEKEGHKVYTTEVICKKITFLQQKKEENEFKDMSVKTEQQQQFEISPEDLPF